MTERAQTRRGERPRIIGIDFGTKRVGVAISDPLGLFAAPVGTYAPDRVLYRLAELHSGPGFAAVVVGWPLTLGGEEGPATVLVERFVGRLKQRFSEVEVVRWDERFTSEQARAAIREAGARRKARRNRERVDAAAAAIILQEYLDDLNRREPG